MQPGRDWPPAGAPLFRPLLLGKEREGRATCVAAWAFGAAGVSRLGRLGRLVLAALVPLAARPTWAVRFGDWAAGHAPCLRAELATQVLS